MCWVGIEKPVFVLVSYDGSIEEIEGEMVPENNNNNEYNIISVNLDSDSKEEEHVNFFEWENKVELEVTSETFLNP